MIIAPIVPRGPRGGRKPRVVSTPPPNSDPAAAVAQGVPGFRPSDSSQRAVPFKPGPLNQPKSFCDPWPVNNPPTASRKISSPISLIVLDSSRPLNTPISSRVSGLLCFFITSSFIVGAPYNASATPRRISQKHPHASFSLLAQGLNLSNHCCRYKIAA